MVPETLLAPRPYKSLDLREMPLMGTIVSGPKHIGVRLGGSGGLIAEPRPVWGQQSGKSGIIPTLEGRDKLPPSDREHPVGSMFLPPGIPCCNLGNANRIRGSESSSWPSACCCFVSRAFPPSRLSLHYLFYKRDLLQHPGQLCVRDTVFNLCFKDNLPRLIKAKPHARGHTVSDVLGTRTQDHPT